jgi:alpha-glucoside transport system permease protein
VDIGRVIAQAVPKLAYMSIALVLFFGFILLLFAVAEKLPERWQNPVRYLVFLGPALGALTFGIIYPTVRTTWLSLFDARGQEFIGLRNYVWAFTQPEIQRVLINTAIWVLVAPALATVFGLAMAVLSDRMKRATIPKSLIFMPMAISFVGAGIIWKFVYEYRDPEFAQIGLLNQIWIAVGVNPPNWLLTAPLNTFLLIVVMVWIQTGFAMVVLSAAIRGIPDDVIEAAMIDGATGWRQFVSVTVPMIRGTLIVVLSTITIITLKVFDIVRTMTGGNFQTSVIANEMYTQTFRSLNYGTGSALAVILFVTVIPLIIYNMRQLRKEASIR